MKPMEHAPRTAPESMSAEQIEERLAQIDQALFAISERINAAPAAFQESRSGDDDATEYESIDQLLAEIRREREALEAEAAGLRERLAILRKAA